MSSKIVSAKLTGNPDEGGWVQVYEFVPDEAEKLKLRGQLSAVIATSVPKEGIDSVLAGREVLLRLHEEYFGKMDGSAYERLKLAVEKVLTEFSEWEDVEIAAAAFVEGTTYLACGGGAKISILRDGKLTRIVDSEKEDINIASGYIRDGDVIVAGSRKFMEKFPEGVIKGALAKPSIDDAVDDLAPALHSQQLSGNLGALFIKVKGDEFPGFNIVNNKEEKVPQEESMARPNEEKEIYVSKGQRIDKSNSLFSKLKETIKKPKIYVQEKDDEEQKRNRKVSATVGLFLLAILVVSIFFGIKQKRKNDEKENFEQTISSAQHELDEAQKLFSLNPERSRELINSARGKVLSLTDEGVDNEELTSMKSVIDESQRKILGEYKVDGELFVDLSLLSSNFEGTDISFSNGIVFVADRKGKKIVSIKAETKRSEVVSGPGVIDEMYGMTSYAGAVYIINDEGVYEVDQGKDKKIDSDWGSGAIPFSYAGNMYLLDKSASTIWRYSGSEGDFGSRTDWITEGTSPDLTDAKQMIIDGSIWILKNSGDIYKFEAGNRLNFSINGLYPPLASPQAFYTDEDLDDLYLLDVDNGRVVVVDKKGKYIAQYLSESFKNAVNLVVSKKEKIIVVLTGEELLSVRLEHLN